MKWRKDNKKLHGQAPDVANKRTMMSTFVTADLATLYSSEATSWLMFKQGFLNFSIWFLATTSNAWSGVKSPSLIPV